MKDKEFKIPENLKSQFNSLSNEIDAWNKDPRHWTNNKRKLHGYPTLRGKANKKDRFNPPVNRWIQQSNLFDSLSSVMEDIVKEEVNSIFDKFVDIRDVKFGTRAEFK